MLASILRKSRHGVRLNEHLEHPDGAEVFQHASQMGLEGIVVQAARVALQIRPLAGLAEVQEPGGTCSEAGGGRGLGAVMTDQGNARFLGVFQHFYSTNRFGDASYGTHYIVLAYELRLDHRPVILLDEQHSKSKWMADADLVSASDVHENTKAYFREDPP